jgi:cytochrome c peroxidase
MSRWILRLLLAAVPSASLFFGWALSQEHQSLRQSEIAQVQQQVDSIEAEALASIPALVPGSSKRLVTLGKILFYDKALSVNYNEACAFSSKV